MNFCTDANPRAERMRITNTCRVFIANVDPQSMLHLGNCNVANKK